MFEERNFFHTHVLSVHGIHITKQNIEEYSVVGQNECKTSTYECKKCGRILSKKNYKYHVDDHDSMKWKCICGWLFKNQSLFQSHALYSHQISVTKNNIHNFTLNNDKSQLADVLLAGNKILEACPLCGRENLNRRVYDNHVKNHGRLEYKCDEVNCGWMFENEYGLCYHMQMKHKYSADLKNMRKLNSIERCATDIAPAADVHGIIVKREIPENGNNSNLSEGNASNVGINTSNLTSENENAECRQHLKFQCFETGNYKVKEEPVEDNNSMNSDNEKNVNNNRLVGESEGMECKEHSIFKRIEDCSNKYQDDENALGNQSDKKPVPSMEKEEEMSFTRYKLIRQLVAHL